MTISPKWKKTMLMLMKIFFVGLVLQFFLNTVVSFKMGFKGGYRAYLWMWKEALLAFFFAVVVLFLVKAKQWKIFVEKSSLKRFSLILVFMLVFVVLVSFFVTGSDMGTTILSLRYAFSGFVVFVVCFGIGWIFFDKEKESLLEWFNKFFKLLLILSLLWWAIIWLMPKLLTFAGYTVDSFEGTVGTAPPAVYFTQYSSGFVRNQFLFERPISRGFFLVAFWPLFFLRTIKNRGRGSLVFWGGIYGLSVLSTFSRAAWIVWILTTLGLILAQYKKNFWKTAWYLVFPMIIILGTLTYFGRDQIINRSFSNTGHIEHIKTAVNHIKAHPIWGLGAGSAGPASHISPQFEPYNPENQYLQIWLEYGLFGFAGWLYLYVFLHFIGLKALLALKTKKLSKKQKQDLLLLASFSLGLLGLSIEGLVLHSFVDRMIVYPFMALFGIVYALHIKEKEKIENFKLSSTVK